jgi:L-ascorbate metabolism protein UlaG (beta-lactamase superfamily)
MFIVRLNLNTKSKEFILSSTSNSSLNTGKGSIFFIGNATVLITYAGYTILTDPTFIHMHEKVHLGYGLHTTRLTNPAIDINELPPLDFILLSHFHGDHFDQVAIKELDKSIPIITTPHAASELKSRGFNKVEELEKWQEISFLKDGIRLNITATPGRHGPFPISIFMPQVMGSVLDFYSENKSLLFRIYITGDTLVFDDIKDIPKRFPNTDIALLHLGGTTVMGIMVTMDSKEGLKMFKIIDPKKAIPIHYNDYDVFKSSIDDFKKDALDAGIDGRIYYLNHGESYTFENEKNVK